jgi:hypothetical protein
MSRTSTHEKETETDIIIEDICYDVTFNRVIKYYRENYGTDADGNRGEMRTFIDEDYAEDIEVDGVPIKQLLPELQSKIEAELEKWLEDNEPEG